MSFRLKSPEGKAVLAMIRGGDYAHPGEEDAVERVAATLPRESLHRILDVACGRGRTAAWFQQHGWGQVVGLDVDAVSIECMRAHYPHVEFLHLDVAPAGQLPGEPFDLAYLFTSFYAFTDPAGALGHIRQACREGARRLIFDCTRPDDRRLPAALGEEIGQPIVLSDLSRWLAVARWQPLRTEDGTARFVDWYADLLERSARNRSRIVTAFGTDWYDYSPGWYTALHDALASGALGGHVVHAVAKS